LAVVFLKERKRVILKSSFGGLRDFFIFGRKKIRQS
jgi:hypothetical protein